MAAVALLPRQQREAGVIMKTMSVRCCIAGGGPAGMMLGLLLGRAGVDVGGVRETRRLSP